MFADHREAIVPGVFSVIRGPAVNDDGQLGWASEFHLPNEDRFLHIARRVIVKVVEPDFAPGDRLGVPREGSQFVEIGMLGELRLVGMDADGGVDAFLVVRNLDGAIQRAGTSSAANEEHGVDSRVASARENLAAIFRKAFPVEVGMGVYKHTLTGECSSPT